MVKQLKEQTKQDYSKAAQLYISEYAGDHSHFELIDQLIQRQRERRLLLMPTLDLGSGPGSLTGYLVEHGLWNIYAIDITPEFVQYMEEKFKDTPPRAFVHAIEGDMVTVVRELLPALTGRTAAVVAGFSIIHIPDNEVDRLLADIYRLLYPGGLFYMSCYAGTHKGMETEPHVFAAGKKVKTQERLEVYMNYFTEGELRKRIDGVGFTIVELNHHKPDIVPGEIPVAKLEVLAEKPPRETSESNQPMPESVREPDDNQVLEGSSG